MDTIRAPESLSQMCCINTVSAFLPLQLLEVMDVELLLHCAACLFVSVFFL